MSTRQRLGTLRRRCALGGIVGVGGFVLAWLVLGTTRAGYSSTQDAISELARSGAPSAGWMTAGFVAFGVGVPVYAVALRAALPGPAWSTAAASGLCTLGVAAAPLGSADRAHVVAAGLGYVTLALTPALGTLSFSRGGRHGWAAWSAAAAALSAVALLASVVAPWHGLTQRLGLGVVDVWIAATAVTMWRTGRVLVDPTRPADLVT